MKKVTKLLLALSMVGIFASTTFSEISFGAWGRGIFSPLTSNHKEEIVPNNGVSWGGRSARIGWSIRGNSDNVGFQVDMNSDLRSIGFQDQQKIWVKLFDMLTVEVGPSIFYGALRGDAAFGVWNYMRFSGQDDEDAIFARGKAGMGDQWYHRQNGNGIQGGWGKEPIFGGALAHLDVAGFHAFISLDQSTGSKIGDTLSESYSSAIMFKRGQYGLGYEIPNFGLVRAQYIGKAYLPSDTEDLNDVIENKELANYGIIQAALKVDKIVENLYIDVGASFATEKQSKTGDNYGYNSFGGYVKYGLEKVTLHAMGKFKLKMKAKENKDDTELKEGTGIHAGVGADINVGGITINGDVRIFNNFWTNNPDGNHSVGFLAGVSKGFSNGRIAAGFEFITAGTINAGLGEKQNTDDPMWALPIIFEYWF
ncbi:MAG: hypothetical protein PVI26_08455 [Chitinispirillia bacterium]|jgi:hypothetical protein